VVGSDNQKIGDVKDILFTKDGKIDAYIISVGGFLGVGAKEVAIAPSSAQFMADDKDKDSFKLKVNLNKDQLAQAPNFEEHKAQRMTTGAGTGWAPAPDSTTARFRSSGGVRAWGRWPWVWPIPPSRWRASPATRPTRSWTGS